MPHYVCAVTGCQNHTRKLRQWKTLPCEKHECNYGTGECDCPPPFTLFPFPTEIKDSSARTRWTKAIRENSLRENWNPTRYEDRICSDHFVGGEPTEKHPDPTLNLNICSQSKRERPINFEDTGEDDDVPAEKKRKMAERIDDEHLDDSDPDDESSRGSHGDLKISENSQDSHDVGSASDVKMDENSHDSLNVGSTSDVKITDEESQDSLLLDKEKFQSDKSIDLTLSTTKLTQDGPLNLKSSSHESESRLGIKIPTTQDEPMNLIKKSSTLLNAASSDANKTTPVNLKFSNGKLVSSAVTMEKNVNMKTQQLILPKPGGGMTLQSSSNPSSRSGTPLVQYSTLSASNTPVQSRSNTPVLSRNSTPSSSGARGVPFLQYGVPSLMTPTSTQLQSQSKYSELLAVVEDMSKDVRPTYAGSKTSMERFKRGIAYAKILLQQCKAEVRRSAKY